MPDNGNSRVQGDMSAALEFHRQVQNGSLRGDRHGRGGNRASGNPSHSYRAPLNANSPYTARDGSIPSSGNWGARLATGPPSHIKFPTVAQRPNPTAANSIGDPMNVDENPANPKSGGLGNSGWAGKPDFNSGPAYAPPTPANSSGAPMGASGPAKSMTMPGHNNARQRGPNTAHALQSSAHAQPTPATEGHAMGVGMSAAAQPMNAHQPRVAATNAIHAQPSNPQGSWGVASAPAPSAVPVPPSHPQDTWGRGSTPTASRTPGPIDSKSPMVTNQQVPVNAAVGRIGAQGESATTGTISKDESVGIGGSRWAPKKGAAIVTHWGVDQGRVVDNDWTYTYAVEMLGRSFGQAAEDARAGGDHRSEEELRHIAKLCGDVVHARTRLQNEDAEHRARDGANKAIRSAAYIFTTKYPESNYPGMRELYKAFATIRAMKSTQPGVQSVPRTEPVAPVTASIGVVTQGVQTAGLSNPPIVKLPSQGSATFHGVQNQARPVQQQTQPTQKSQTIQQPVQAPHATGNAAGQTSGFGQGRSVPTTFEDPAAQWLFDSFFSRKGRN